MWEPVAAHPINVAIPATVPVILVPPRHFPALLLLSRAVLKCVC